MSQTTADQGRLTLQASPPRSCPASTTGPSAKTPLQPGQTFLSAFHHYLLCLVSGVNGQTWIALTPKGRSLGLGSRGKKKKKINMFMFTVEQKSDSKVKVEIASLSDFQNQ